jgi:hypothetical protein
VTGEEIAVAGGFGLNTMTFTATQSA